MHPSLLILAAGSGTRYGGLKQLDALGPNGETIMDYSIQDALSIGFGKVVLVIRKEFQGDFEKKIVARWKDKTKIEFAYQDLNPVFEGSVAPREKPWGPIHALLCAKPLIYEPFVVVNADDFYGKEAFRLMAEFLHRKCTARHYAMAGYILANTLSEHGSVSRGVCEVDRNGHLIHVQEMKEVHKSQGGVIGFFNGEKKILNPESLVSMNCWGFSPEFFNEAALIFNEFVCRNANDPKAEMVIPDVVDVLVKSGKSRVSVLPCNEKWVGVTHREDRESVMMQLRQFSGT